MGQRINTLVDWAVMTRPTALGWLGFAAENIVWLGVAMLTRGWIEGHGDPPRRPPRLPDRPDRTIRPLNIIVGGGTAPWMPAEWAGRPQIRMTAESARVALPNGRTLPFDPMRARVMTVHPQPPVQGLKWDTWCEVEVVGHDAAGYSLDLSLSGSWLAFAWLGHLGDWPQPGLPAETPHTWNYPDSLTDGAASGTA